MTQQFTASEVLHKLRERFTSGNSVPVPDVRLTRAEFDAFADLLEAQEKTVPVAYAAGLEANMRGFLDVMAWSEGEFTIPLYTHPDPADAERLAEALRAFPEDPNPFTYRRCYANARAALAAHSAPAQPPAARVTDAMVMAFSDAYTIHPSKKPCLPHRRPPMIDTMTLEQVLIESRIVANNGRVSITRKNCAEWADAIDAAIKQRDQDKEDAARYRWLRKQHNSSIPSWHVRSSTNSIPLDLDIGLDAEMEKESGQ